MRKILNKTATIVLSVSLLTGAFAAASRANAQDQTSSFNLQQALTNPAAAEGAKNLKYCLYGNIDLALRNGLRNKAEIAAKVAPACYHQLADPLRRQHLLIMSDAEFERVIERVAYGVIDDVAAQETAQ